MKPFALFMYLFLQTFSSFAQKEYNTWYFGDHAGLIFNEPGTNAVTDGAMYTLESSSSICDEKGKLLFYTDGDTVWNGKHQYMKNNVSSAYFFHSTSTQGSVIIKKPGSDHLYYIFCSRSSESFFSDCCARYWLIDKNGDGGNGEVIKMNEQLPLKNPVEGLCITKHTNETDIWIGTFSPQDGTFSFMRTIQGELDNSVVITDLKIKGENYFCSKFSPDSKILLSYRVVVPVILPDNIVYKSVFYLHHFNNATGLLYDHLEIEAPNVMDMAVEYSHNAQYLYVSTNEGELYQYDLSVWDKDIIQRSAVRIYHNPEKEIMGLQLGPDKKIYAFPLYSEDLIVIDKPWLKGESSIERQITVSTKGRKNQFGAPYYPTFVFKRNWDLETLQCFVPNAFSPNGDNLNDVFSVSTPDLDDLAIKVYNRWGQKIYDEHRLNASWDGTFGGKMCPPDVYVYSITVTRKSEVKQLSGNVTLLR